MRLKFIEIQDLALASALLTLGVPLIKGDIPVIKVKTTSGEITKFLFEDISNCGKFKTQEMISAWYNEKFVSDNPDHPLSYIKCSFSNRDNLLDHVKKMAAFVVVEKNGKMLAISEITSEKQTQKLLKEI